MRRGGILALILGVLLAGWARAAAPAAPDAFLDEVIKLPPESDSFVYLEQVEGLKKVAGKPMVFPPGLLEFAGKANLKLGWRMGASTNPPVKRREYFNQTASNLGLKWVYDPKRDAIVWNLLWPQTTATHSGRENVQIVLKGYPQPKPDPFVKKDTPASLALQELLHAPTSQPMSWQAFLLVRENGSLFISYPDDFSHSNYCAKMLKDPDGHSHLLILIESVPMCIPGPAPKYFLFLFSEEGIWEDFGSFEAGTSRMPSLVDWEPEPAVKFISRRYRQSQYSVGIGGGDFFQHDIDPWLGWPSFAYDAGDKRVSMTITWTDSTVYRWIIGVDKNRLTCTTTRDGVAVPLSDCKPADFTELTRLPK